VIALAVCQDLEVVGIPYDSPDRFTVPNTFRALDFGHHPATGQNAALLCTGRGVHLFTELCEQPGFEKRLDQSQHPLVLDPGAHSVHQGRVVDPVKGPHDLLPVSRTLRAG